MKHTSLYRSVSAAVIIEFRMTDMKMRLRRVIAVSDKFLPEPRGAHVWSVLKAQEPGSERNLIDRQPEFARFLRNFPHLERVLADRFFRFETHELDQNFLAHFAPTGLSALTATFLRALLRRTGGSPSAWSTTMMVVTNFFMP
jgi:hypothetical protein